MLFSNIYIKYYLGLPANLSIFSQLPMLKYPNALFEGAKVNSLFILSKTFSGSRPLEEPFGDVISARRWQ